MPGPLTRPSDFFLRNSHYKRGLLFLSSALPASIAVGYAFWHLYAVPKQRSYVEFYKYVYLFICVSEILEQNWNIL